MTDSEKKHPTFTDAQALRLWGTYLKRWGELVHDKIMSEAQRCESLSPYEQAYLRAFWQGLASKVNRLNTDPLSVPAQTREELERMWKTIALEFELPLVDDALVNDVEKRLEFFKRKIAHEFEGSILETINRHDITSPLEQIFLIQWKYQCVEPLHKLTLQPQARVLTDRGTYIVDFIVSAEGGQAARVAIELDGHEFHERSKTQASKDKSRERAIVSTGIPVLRFTGSEVFNNPRRVIDEVIRYFKANAA